MEVQRKPIMTVKNRRNAEYHPEFLDTEALLKRFEPLLKSIQRRFLAYRSVYANQDDKNDLYSQLVYEFLRLRQSFDPRYGVDFTGYVKFHLQQRVFLFSMKAQNVAIHELPSVMFPEDYDDKNMELENHYKLSDEYLLNELDDMDEMEKAEARASVPWDDLDELQKELVTEILYNGKTIEDIARQKHTTNQKIQRQFDELCKHLIELHQLNTIKDE